MVISGLVSKEVKYHGRAQEVPYWQMPMPQEVVAMYLHTLIRILKWIRYSTIVSSQESVNPFGAIPEREAKQIEGVS